MKMFSANDAHAKLHPVKIKPSHKGELHRDLGVPQGKKIPKSKLAAAAKRKGKVGQRARFAETLSKLRK